MILPGHFLFWRFQASIRQKPESRPKGAGEFLGTFCSNKKYLAPERETLLSAPESGIPLK